MSEARKVSIDAFPGELESEARSLHEDALAGSESILRSVDDPVNRVRIDNAFRRSVMCSAHAGFSRAQNYIIDRREASVSGTRLSPALDALYRCTMDAIAWQIIHCQLYLARRLYQGQKPPDLASSNFASVRRAAADLTREDYSSFALIADLTSFIQVGDLMVMDADAGMTLVEVKEGETNRRVGEFAEFFAQSQCTRALQFFREQEGEKTYKQLGRVLRQAARLSHVVSVVNNGESMDPDSKLMVRVPEAPFELEDYDFELTSVLERSKNAGWAIEHVDGCLFLGAYRGDMRAFSKSIFSAWFKGCGGTAQFPLVNLFSMSTRAPLGLPIACRTIPREHKFDLMFGRVVVFLALDMNRFVELCNERELPARWSSRKEAERINQATPKGFERPWTCDKRAILLGENGAEGALYDGIFMRMLSHGTRPESAVAILKSLYGSGKTA